MPFAGLSTLILNLMYMIITYVTKQFLTVITTVFHVKVKKLFIQVSIVKILGRNFFLTSLI